MSKEHESIAIKGLDFVTLKCDSLDTKANLIQKNFDIVYMLLTFVGSMIYYHTRNNFLSVQFHIAHLFEIQNKFELAKDAYQAIIAAPGMPPHIQSVAWRQLGR